MSSDLIVVLVILVLAVALFVSDKVRLDLVAVLVVLALALTGVLTPAQALAGFADPLVIMIAGLFVVAGALTQTGIAQRVARSIGDLAGNDEMRLVAAIMLATAVLSGFMSSTGTVAVMLPIVVALGWRAGVSPSRLLLPLAFASLLGGMLTLIGTPPNLVASQLLEAKGRAPLGFFAFTPIGAIVTVVGIAVMALVGRRLLPKRAPIAPGGASGEREPLQEVALRYGLPDRFARLVVPAASPLMGATLGELKWPERLGVQVLAVDTDPAAVRAHRRSRRHLNRSKRIGPGTRIEEGDRILLQGSRDGMARLAADYGVRLVTVDPSDEGIVPADLTFAEVLPTPRSRWLGQTLANLRFRERFDLQVVALRRGVDTVREGLATERLRFGDTLLVEGPIAALALLRQERHDAVVLSVAGQTDESAPKRDRAPVAAVILGAMLAVLTFGWLPAVIAVVAAASALVLTGCIDMDEAYRSVQWPSVVLIAGMLPLATALEASGGVQAAVNLLVATLGSYGPLALAAALFLLTSVASQVISNTATAVLLAPIAFEAALLLDIAPEPMVVVVALAASTAFASPVASPVNTLVLGPGQYRFMDFVRIGVPLQIVVMILTLLLLPVFFPF
jgi:di/tricarboxylate transporter